MRIFESSRESAARVGRYLSLWIPVLLQMGLIFYFSNQPSGSPALESFPFSSIVGHFGGYALLSLLLYRAFAGGFRCWNIKNAGKACLVAFLYAISDEIHQSFVPGRNPSVLDVLVDSGGIVFALLAVRVWVSLGLSKSRSDLSQRHADSP